MLGRRAALNGLQAPEPQPVWPAGLGVVTGHAGLPTPQQVSMTKSQTKTTDKPDHKLLGTTAQATDNTHRAKHRKPTRVAAVETRPTSRQSRPVIRARRVAASASVDAATATPSPERISKRSTIETLLRRPDGTSIDELTSATGWQQHSLRAAFTGLRKRGHDVQRERGADNVTRYRIAACS